MPFYVAAPTTTLDPALADGGLIKIEERDPTELTDHRGHRVAAPGINVITQTQYLKICSKSCTDGKSALSLVLKGGAASVVGVESCV